MTVSILIVDHESDVAELFHQRFRRDARQDTYVPHLANSGEAALRQLDDGIEPVPTAILSDINMPGLDDQVEAARSAGHDGDRLWRR